MSAIRSRALAPVVRRQRAQQRAQAMVRLFFGGGGYDGARSDRPALKNWSPFPGGPNAETLPDLDALRGRSADLARNAPIATGVLATNVTSTVGTGIVPHARIDRDFLGLSDDDADAWERDAERIFDQVASSTRLDLSGELTFYQLEGLVLRSALERGDVFAVRRYRENAGDVLGTKVQLVEADRVSNPLAQPQREGFMGGIEYDPFTGRRIRIHVSDSHPGESFLGPFSSMAGALRWTPEAVYGAETGTRRVLQIMDTTRVHQMRGVPYFAPVIELFKQLTRYTDAEIMAAVVNSFLTVFIKTTEEEDEDLLPDMGDPNTLADTRARAGTQNDIRLGAGAVVGLGPNEEIQQTKVERPNPQFDPFILAVLRQIGVALEVPFELLVKHFTASYSASRAAMLEAWRSVRRRRSWLVTAFCQPVYEWVIEEAIARGLLNAPGFFDNPFIRHAYLAVDWIGEAMGSLDPESDVAAAAKRVELGITTLAEETAQMTGGDWERNHRQRVKETNMRRRDQLEGELIGERIITEPRQPVPADGVADDEGDGEETEARRSKLSPARADRAEMRRDRAPRARRSRMVRSV